MLILSKYDNTSSWFDCYVVSFSPTIEMTSICYTFEFEI